MDKLKVAVLYYQYVEKGKMVHDVVVENVTDALQTLGHHFTLAPVSDNLGRLVDLLHKQKPDIVFNICESFAGMEEGERHIVAMLEMLRYRFTGSGSVAMALTGDKALTKKILSFHGILTPQFAVVDRKNIELAGKMRFPLFIKPVRSDSSRCVGQRSLVNDFDSLVERIRYVHEHVKDAALVEEYIAGREFYLGTIGNDPPVALPLIELDFSRITDGSRHIYDHKAKNDSHSLRYKEMREIAAVDLPGEWRSQIDATAVAAVQAVSVCDYARVDLRVTPAGQAYVVEINANPYLMRQDTLALAARQHGLEYAQFIGRILEAAWIRGRPFKPLPNSAKGHPSKAATATRR